MFGQKKAQTGDSNPQGLVLAPTPKVFGLSKKPLGLALGLIALIVFVYVAVMIKKGEDRSQKEETQSSIKVDRASNSNTVIPNADRNQGIIVQPPEHTGIIEDKNKGKDEDVRIVQVRIPEQPKQDWDAEEARLELQEIRRMKAEQLKNAIVAPLKTNVQVATSSTVASTNSGFVYTPPAGNSEITVENMTAHLRGDIPESLKAQLQSSSSGTGGGMDFFGTSSTSTGISSATDATWQLGFSRQAGRMFELKTGAVIPAVMISGIISDLAGSVTAQVSQDVYDSTSGKFLLIPRGAKLYGDYASSVNFGQNRLFVSWKRILFPDGSSITLGDMRGSDQGGYSGFNDQVDNHYLRIFGSAILMSMITGGVTYSVDTLNKGSSDADNALQDEMSIALAQQIGQASMNLLQKHLGVAPTLEIRSGYKFNIITTKDIVFAEPYTQMARR